MSDPISPSNSWRDSNEAQRVRRLLRPNIPIVLYVAASVVVAIILLVPTYSPKKFDGQRLRSVLAFGLQLSDDARNDLNKLSAQVVQTWHSDAETVSLVVFRDGKDPTPAGVDGVAVLASGSGAEHWTCGYQLFDRDESFSVAVDPDHLHLPTYTRLDGDAAAASVAAGPFYDTVAYKQHWKYAQDFYSPNLPAVFPFAKNVDVVGASCTREPKVERSETGAVATFALPDVLLGVQGVRPGIGRQTITFAQQVTISPLATWSLSSGDGPELGSEGQDPLSQLNRHHKRVFLPAIVESVQPFNIYSFNDSDAQAAIDLRRAFGWLLAGAALSVLIVFVLRRIGEFRRTDPEV